MKLSHLANKILLADLKKLVGLERISTLQILYHLKEVDRRKLYSDLKYSSLFAYCVKELGYSESSAQRRIIAARLLTQMPEIGPKIENGKLSLSNIAQVAQTTKDPKVQKVILEEVEGMSRRECEKKIFEMTGEVLPTKESAQRISDSKMKVAIILSDETLALMEKVKHLHGKDMSSDELIQFAMNVALEKIEKEKFKQTSKTESLPPAAVKRTVSTAVKRDVYFRDKKCSQCGSLKNLNFDHRKPFALGGLSDIENIRLLCSNCNQRARMRAGLSTGQSAKGLRYKRLPP